MRISKYVLYVLVLFITAGFFVVPKCYRLLVYRHTKGYVSHYEERCRTTNRGLRCYKYPVVLFTVDRDTFYFLQPADLTPMVRAGDTVEVVYDPDDPGNANTTDFWGSYYWAFIFLLPFCLIWTAMIFNPDIFKKKVKLW